jgi:hypothetical protein
VERIPPVQYIHSFVSRSLRDEILDLEAGLRTCSIEQGGICIVQNAISGMAIRVSEAKIGENQLFPRSLDESSVNGAVIGDLATDRLAVHDP